MRYDLVFEGGGAKGMVFVGAMEEFVADGHTFDRLLGTSAGAIVAVVLAAGYSPAELAQLLGERKDGEPVFASFMATPPPYPQEHVEASETLALLRAIDLPLMPDFMESRFDAWLARTIADNPRYRHGYAFIEEGGWYSAHTFVAWLESKLDSGAVNGAPRAFGPMTLREFHAATEHPVSIIAADTTDGRMLILNHTTAPDCPVVWAVRMSMSIPMVWPQVAWRAEWGTYRGQEITGHQVVDGGVLSNFPLELLVSRLPSVTEVMGEKRSDSLLGLLIDEKRAVPGAPSVARQPDDDAEGAPQIGEHVAQMGVVQHLQRLVDTMTKGHDKMFIDALEEYVVRLPAKGYGTTEFGMSDERRDALVAGGRRAMREYLDRAVPAPGEISFGLPEEDEPAAETTDYCNRVAERILLE